MFSSHINTFHLLDNCNGDVIVKVGWLPVKVEVLFMRVNQLHFGLLQQPQPLVVEMPSPGVLLLSLALRSVSRRLLGRLSAINAGS